MKEMSKFISPSLVPKKLTASLIGTLSHWATKSITTESKTQEV